MLPRICSLRGLEAIKLTRHLKLPVTLVSTCKTRASQAVGGSGQRDLVNFPRIKRLEFSPPCVLGFIPKSWFDFFYSKTGVTGGYTLLFNVTVYLLSKEIIVIDIEAITAMSFILLLTIIHNMVPEIGEYAEKQQKKSEEELNRDQELCKIDIRQNIESIKQDEFNLKAIVSMLPEAKRENVYLQMEAAYRVYLRDVHLATLNILNYNVEKSNIENLFIKKNLLSWIMHRIEESISPEVKKAALEKAISDIKLLAASGDK